MKPKFFLAAGVVLTLAFMLVLGTAAAQPASPCDPAYVGRTGNIIRVSPTGVDDTANIQCAFDWAIDRGPGMTIQLQPGTFHTAQIVVIDFHGAFRGSGIRHTEVINLPNLQVGDDYEAHPPSAENPYPDLFLFINSDVELSHMAIRIFGENPIEPWWTGGWGPFYELACIIMVTGTESHFYVSHVELEGEPTDSEYAGHNVINGIYYEGFVNVSGVTWERLSGTYVVNNSTFKTIGWPTDVINLMDATVLIHHNDFINVKWAFDSGDLVNTTLRFHNNRITATDGGLMFSDYITPSDVNTHLLIRNNLIKAPYGIAMYQTMDDASTCLIKTNKLQWVTDTPIFLGPGAEACVLKNNRE